MDTVLSPILDALRVCTAEALTGTLGGDALCTTSLVPGTLAVADWCTCRSGGGGCGMAWVRLSDLFPSAAAFPSPDNSTKTSCTSVLAAVIEVGVYRCAPQPGPRGEPPTAAEQTQAALIQADDAMALHRAIKCCDEVTRRPNVLGRYTPRPGGDCGGGAWTLTVQLLRR